MASFGKKGQETVRFSSRPRVRLPAVAGPSRRSPSSPARM